MNLFTSLKIAAIKLADKVNKAHNPFDDFTRPALPKEIRQLADLEKEFFNDLNENFWRCGNQVLVHRIPLDPKLGLDLGDQALWHGVYTAMLAMRYKMTGQGEHLLRQAAQGLLLHQTAHGEAQPRLIRGVSDDLKTWGDNCSNDTATGHLLGIYFLWKYGPKSCESMCRLLAAGLATEILTHHHALVTAGGTPTTYGALEQGWKTDPMRISLALAIYAVAYKICGALPFKEAYEDLAGKYREMACYAKVSFWGWENPNDTHRAAIHLAILSDLSSGPERLSYRRGLDRIRDIVDKDGNVWVNALCAFGIGSSRPDDGWVHFKVLSEFTLESKQFNPGRDNSKAQFFAFSGYPFHRVLWKGTWMANQPLPRWAVRSQDFFWQRNLRSLDVDSDELPPDSRFNGGDWLCAYWLSSMLP